MLYLAPPKKKTRPDSAECLFRSFNMDLRNQAGLEKDNQVQCLPRVRLESWLLNVAHRHLCDVLASVSGAWQCMEGIWWFSKIRGTLLGVPVIRAIVFGGL